MRLQILLPNASSGYAAPYDLSIKGAVKTLDEVKSTVEKGGFANPACTILHGGYVVEKLGEGESPHDGSFLAVLQDAVTRVILPDSVCCVSLADYSVSVSSLKTSLAKRTSIPEEDMMVLNLHGELLQDSNLLKDLGCIGPKESLICRQQIPEYRSVVAASGKMLAMMQAGQELQKNWCQVVDSTTTSSLQLSAAQFAEKMMQSIKATPCENVGESGGALLESSYDRFLQDFLDERSPIIKNSTTLADVWGQFLSVNENSNCPKEVEKIAGTVIVKLQGKNCHFADKIAESLRHLLPIISKLAAKTPLKHEHVSYAKNIVSMEEAMNRYRNIRAGKMYRGTDQFQQKTAALQALQEEMSESAKHFSALIDEWKAVQTWSDLTCFDRIQAENITPSMDLAKQLIESATVDANQENTRLLGLQQVEQDAIRYNNLIQNQVRWCLGVIETACAREDADIEDLDMQIRALLAERSAKQIVRNRLSERAKILEEHAKKESALFETFKAQYVAKHKVITERMQHAKLGREVVQSFQTDLDRLQRLVTSEIDKLRRVAHELNLDVSADCIAAHKVANGVNFMLAHYEKEKVQSVDEDNAKSSNEFEIAMMQMRTDRAEECRMKVDDCKRRLTESGRKIQEHTDAIERLKADITAPWEFACRHALAGPVAPSTAAQIRLRTSQANKEAWGGEDRCLELPDEWNQEMQSEAVAYMKMLRIGS